MWASLAPGFAKLFWLQHIYYTHGVMLFAWSWAALNAFGRFTRDDVDLVSRQCGLDDFANWSWQLGELLKCWSGLWKIDPTIWQNGQFGKDTKSTWQFSWANNVNVPYILNGVPLRVSFQFWNHTLAIILQEELAKFGYKSEVPLRGIFFFFFPILWWQTGNHQQEEISQICLQVKDERWNF
jgi:hypothetical protein